MDLRNSAPGTVEREFAVLVHSDHLYDWIRLNNTSLKYAFHRLDVPSAYFKTELIDVDVKTVGCKFTTDAIRAKLAAASGTQPPNSLVEHCWSLSNSCGEFVDPSDIRRFKKLTFSGAPAPTSDDVTVGTRVGSYLAHCMNLFDKSLTESNRGRTVMFEAYAKKVREYYHSTDLYYLKPSDNILLTGVIYDFLTHYNVSLSTYKSDLDNFTLFLNSYAPLIDETWVITWLNPPPDPKMMFEFTAQDLHVSLPYYNINDAKVIVGNALRLVESVVTSGPLTGLREKLDAILKRDNKNLSTERLWAAFHCYYGTYRTGRTRAIARPDTYVVPSQIGGYTVNFAGVEKLFSDIQKGLPDINVRRQFCGSLAGEALRLFKASGIGFPPITTLNIPNRYRYLNIDYYKHADRDELDEEEKLILSNISMNVDEICVNRNLSTAPSKERKGLGKKMERDAQRGHTLFDKRDQRRELTRQLWDGVRRLPGHNGRSQK